MSDLLEGQVELDPTVDFIAGSIAGMTSLIVGFPFDTVKVRFQSPETRTRYRSTVHAVSTIIREEKFVGLYKGIASPLATVPVMNGLVFASYRFLMKLQLPHPDALPTLTQITLAGAGTGVIGAILTTPIELIKIRQQTNTLTRTSATAVGLQIFRESGVPGLYRGITATALRDLGYGAYFLAYEGTCRMLARPLSADGSTGSMSNTGPAGSAGLSWPALLFAGGMAGVFGWLATFPFDVIKTRMQGTERTTGLPLSSPVTSSSSTIVSNSSSPLLPRKPLQDGPNLNPNPYRTTWSTIVHSYRTEGVGVFYRGMAPTLIRAIPVNMVTFATFESIVQAFA